MEKVETSSCTRHHLAPVPAQQRPVLVQAVLVACCSRKMYPNRSVGRDCHGLQDIDALFEIKLEALVGHRDLRVTVTGSGFDSFLLHIAMQSLMWPLFLFCIIPLELVSAFLPSPSLAGLSGRSQKHGYAVHSGCPIHQFSSSGTFSRQRPINTCRSGNSVIRHTSDNGVHRIIMSANGAVSDVVWVRPPPRGSKDIVFGGR
jgi:hypothetical protein